jgi:diphthamide biosynthesis methyltransferase
MKTVMAFVLARIEMLYIEKDSVHWEMYKNESMEKEKEQMIDFAYGCTQHISREDIEEYYNKTFNPKKEELLSFLAKQAQELDLGYEEFELGGEG